MNSSSSPLFATGSSRMSIIRVHTGFDFENRFLKFFILSLKLPCENVFSEYLKSSGLLTILLKHRFSASKQLGSKLYMRHIIHGKVRATIWRVG